MCSASTEDPFIIGLRKIIRTEWDTQEEFAKEVTSKVNMSNILRGTVGTSQRMKEALANKAGLTVEEIIELGRRTIAAAGTLIRPTIQISDMHDLTGTEIRERVNECNLGVQDGFNAYNQAMSNAVAGLIKERDELISLVYQERAILNAIEDVVKVVDKDLKIVSCNRACTEKFMQVIGDDCTVEGSSLCCGKCIAKKAFQTGKIERRMTIEGDTIETCAAYPITDLDGRVGKVAVVCGTWMTSFQHSRKPVFDL